MWKISYIRYASNQTAKYAKFTTTSFIIVFCLYLCVSNPTCPSRDKMCILASSQLHSENKHRGSGSFWAFLHEFLVVIYLILYQLWYNSENLPSLCHLQDASLHRFTSIPHFHHLAFYYFEKNQNILMFCEAQLASSSHFPEGELIFHR